MEQSVVTLEKAPKRVVRRVVRNAPSIPFSSVAKAILFQEVRPND